jgi:hypothetical protein
MTPIPLKTSLDIQHSKIRPTPNPAWRNGQIGSGFHRKLAESDVFETDIPAQAIQQNRPKVGGWLRIRRA